MTSKVPTEPPRYFWEPKHPQTPKLPAKKWPPTTGIASKSYPQHGKEIK